MTGGITVVSVWRDSLAHSLDWFLGLRRRTSLFALRVFIFFLALNLVCYWWALVTAYPEHLMTHEATERVLMGFIVAFLGAVYDSLSLIVTLTIVARALRATTSLEYLGYLSADLVIAIIATFWVLFTFVFAGWVVSFLLDQPETLAHRTALYRGRALSALLNPFAPANVKNVYFGIIMGASALLPTLFHVFLAIRSLWRAAVGAR